MTSNRQGREELVGRVGRLNVAVIAALAVIGSCYWFVQVVEGAYYRELAENNRLRKVAIEASRGLIYDRHGRLLVENVPSYEVRLERRLSRDPTASLAFAAGVLGTERHDLEQLVARHGGAPDFEPVVLAEDLSLEQVARFAVHHLEHPELDIAVDQRRLYRHGRLTAHLLGFLGEIGPQELRRPGDNPYMPGDLVGRSGVEARHEPHLRGVNGEQVVVVDSRGRPVGELERSAASPGKALTLTVDLELQQEAARLLEGRVGAIVALDPQRGDVLALASAPAFDPNRFARRIGREEWDRLLADPHHPLQNRAIHNLYPPGSVFKLALTLAALDLEAASPEERVYCPGYSVFFNHRYRCHRPGGHGRVNLHQAIERSCNVYFHHLGQELGIDTIAAYARRLGLGRPTGIALPGEEAGLVPDSRWSLETRGTPWYPGETISVSTGQGPVLVTPLQVAVMMAAVANGGRLLRPRLLLEGRAEETGELRLEPAHLERLRQALTSVVQGRRGTAAAARVPGVTIAGKTGTAQVVRQESRIESEELPPEIRDHSWFASFAPAEEPEVVLVVFVEHGGAGSRLAAPLARSFYEKYFATDRPLRTAS